MVEPQGPLDILPVVNYQPLLTEANYFSTKQMINQVLSEDQEYVAWKLKDLRTGGTMNNFISQSQIDTTSSQRTNEVSKMPHLNSVPKNLHFMRDIYDRLNANDDEIKGNELSYEDQFKLLVLNLDSEQNNRFEVFHRTSLNKSQVKKLASTVCNQTISENIRVFLQAIGKVYVGEIIELALDVRKKWFNARMAIEFDRRKEFAKRLKKILKKLTQLTNATDVNEKDKQTDIEIEDSVDENESDTYFDDDEDEVREIKTSNKLLSTDKNSQEVRLGLLNHYNKLVKDFNKIDVSIEKYNKSPILPEHIREAWRLYQLQNDTLPADQWRYQGENSGNMFR
ncbi:hypothetical protein KAFR_0E03220 [Kazachstania africana CBS 2517]|uniref:TAFII28-like protein domain-containing protein n=1 Tax=Kazachstania africana (strain ATCC 22294 / BCRC 22015 / CBS 2517 / CECT 1963 / NBRC 1671 / NRRL Y-8276) TaxID=1071382 RepID=H2AVS4_KAZAF|nr:hypothetical protein KAFR_0E03220 [Kazachstania africana CBS 2517]CCF58474.1 hypothetical protein KAFR_0E03220 [Kazachstania africana CBS 2517]